MIKVFPRKTKATPDDGYFGPPPLFINDNEIHISVTFTWDIPYAEKLYYQWEPYGKVSIGGYNCL